MHGVEHTKTSSVEKYCTVTAEFYGSSSTETASFSYYYLRAKCGLLDLCISFCSLDSEANN